MKNKTLKDISYLLNQAKKSDSNRPIIFLGAGASKSGGIPLANEIISDILKIFPSHPEIIKLNNSGKEMSYPTLMECIGPISRNNLMKGYVNNAKINVTHIYLAQLLKFGYIDYILTTNFDNLMIRALALYNIHPPTYDMAILKDLTTTTINEKSIVYLHGQHYGLWLLNTKEEMTKVKTTIPKILNSIKDRTWIIIGYSGGDPIFDQIVNLGRFDKGLYWVAYKNHLPNDNVIKQLLEKDNTNSFIINDYDSDSFMLELNNELDLLQPLIIDKPFTVLKSFLNNIVDIQDQDEYMNIKMRLEIVNKQIDTAIKQFEEGRIRTTKQLEVDIQRDLLIKEILKYSIKRDFKESEIKEFEKKVSKQKNTEVFKAFAGIMNNWGIELSFDAKSNKDENLYRQSFEKFEKSISYDIKSEEIYYNFGKMLSNYALFINDEKLYQQSFEKFEIATSINSNFNLAFNMWGLAIMRLADLKKDEKLYRQSFEKFEIATSIDPTHGNAYVNWGSALNKLAQLKNDEKLYRQSFKKLEIATSINPNNGVAYAIWSDALLQLGGLIDDPILRRQSLQKVEIAIKLGAIELKK